MHDRLKVRLGRNVLAIKLAHHLAVGQPAGNSPPTYLLRIGNAAAVIAAVDARDDLGMAGLFRDAPHQLV